MGLYATRILPRLIDWAMSHPALEPERARVLSSVRGDVLEIGFGTGLNLRHSPPGLRRLAALDPNPGVARLARPRIAESDIQVDYVPLRDGRDIAAPDETFDTVVCTWTLCSIPDAAH